MQTLKVNLISLTPLLMRNPAGSLGTSGSPKPPKERIPTPEDEAEAATYRSEEGFFIFPSSSVRSCIISGGRGFRIGKSSASTIIKGAIFSVSSPEGDTQWLTITDHKGIPLTEYVIDTRRAVVGKAAILRSRPKLNEWQIAVDISYDDRFVAGDVLFQALERAGIVIGLGDFRPACSGEFGRFRVEIRGE